MKPYSMNPRQRVVTSDENGEKKRKLNLREEALYFRGACRAKKNDAPINKVGCVADW